MDFLKDFGVQPTLLFGQIVNFLLILFLLRKFFFGKIVRALEDRRKKIEESLKNADLIEEKLKATEEKNAKIIDDAQQEAQKIIASAKEKANEIMAQTAMESRKMMEEAMLNAKSEIEAEKQKVREELQAETMTLILRVVQKVLGKTLKPKDKREMTKKAVIELERQIS